MSKKSTLSIAVLSALGFAALTGGVRFAHAHCGKCLTDAKHFAESLEKSKMTLATAATLAEVDTGGKAVHATVQRSDGDGVNVEVHVLHEGQIHAVVVDGKTAKILRKQEVKDLEAHASE